MHYSGTLLLAASLSVTSGRYERCCDVLRWNEGLDEWGRLSQDGSIVCLSADGIVVVLDLPISTLKGSRAAGNWASGVPNVSRSIRPRGPISRRRLHAGATGESKSLALGSLPVFIVLDSAEGTN